MKPDGTEAGVEDGIKLRDGRVGVARREAARRQIARQRHVRERHARERATDAERGLVLKRHLERNAILYGVAELPLARRRPVVHGERIQDADGDARPPTWLRRTLRLTNDLRRRGRGAHYHAEDDEGWDAHGGKVSPKQNECQRVELAPGRA